MIFKHFTSQLLSKNQHCLSIKYRFCCSKNFSSKFKLKIETIALLERLALVNFENPRNVNIVETAIEFASAIDSVNTDKIEPLVTVLEDRPLKLREDAVTDGNLRKDVLQNAAVIEEDYFVAPPGNIPFNLQKLKSS